tara:strand:- start:222 stop:422 length:201 start_codon:yes stop_codon:yes gene_type:complete
MFSAYSGENFTIVYIGDDPPKPLKTVDYQVSGVMKMDRQKRKQIEITSYKKVGKIKIHKVENKFNL